MYWRINGFLDWYFLVCFLIEFCKYKDFSLVWSLVCLMIIKKNLEKCVMFKVYFVYVYSIWEIMKGFIFYDFFLIELWWDL